MNTENVSTLKIHKLTKAQYERELGAGRIDPTAIYLTPNEEVLSIEQGGTGANNAADALTNLGAAPAGYGLGTGNAKRISSLDEVTGAGWYSKWFEASELPTGAAHGNLIFYVGFYGSPNYFEIIMPVNHNYTDYSNLSLLKRRRDDSGWKPWEWEHPPMSYGVEYRTTERINGVPVYTQLFDCGVCNNASKITTNISNVERYAAWMSNGLALPYSDAGEWFAKISTNNGYVEVWMNGFTNQRIYVQLWYLKS